MSPRPQLPPDIHRVRRDSGISETRKQGNACGGGVLSTSRGMSEICLDWREHVELRGQCSDHEGPPYGDCHLVDLISTRVIAEKVAYTH